MSAVQIGQYDVSVDSERFRIFPKNAKGKTVPITRINHFLYLRCRITGTVVTFKRYLHMKQWFWRDSRMPQPVAESEVVAEVGRMLFDKDQGRAADLLTRLVLGVELAA